MAEGSKNPSNKPLSFFDLLRKLGQEVDSGSKDLEKLSLASKTKDHDLLASEADAVLKSVNQEVEDVRKNCSEFLSQFRVDCSNLNSSVQTMSSIVIKQKEISTVYSDELGKYGYSALESNKENIPREENSEQHIKCGLTSVAYYEKGSMPCDFHHDGLLVTPGLFPDGKTGTYFCSPTMEKPNDETFVIKLTQAEEKVQIPVEPAILSGINLCNMQLLEPEEPVLLSRQPRKVLTAVKPGENVKIEQKFDPMVFMDPTTPFPPEPVIMSQVFNRNIAHGIKKMNLDEESDEEESNMPEEPHLYSAKKTTGLPANPIHSSKTLTRVICGLEIPDSPELLSVKYHPSSKLLASIRKNHEAEKSARAVTESSQGEGGEETKLENGTIEKSDDSKVSTKPGGIRPGPVIHESRVRYEEPEPLPDPKFTFNVSVLETIPPSPQLLSKPTLAGRYKSDPDPTVTNEATVNPSAQPSSSTHAPRDQRFSIRLVSVDEYDNLADSGTLRSVLSMERMNRCLEAINVYLARKSDPVLTLVEIRDELSFGRHAKDVIVFLLKLGRIGIHKRCSKNPSYVLK